MLPSIQPDYLLLKKSLNTTESPKILVLGDIILDRYTWGSVQRISQEAPIPVLSVDQEEDRLGGASNVMMNLRQLGAAVSACGHVGCDITGIKVIELLKEHGINDQGVFQTQETQTILKQRMLAGSHHLLRMDFDPPEQQAQADEKAVIKFLKENIPQQNLIVISDYGKGFLTERILKTTFSEAKTHKVPVIVDPKKDADYSSYQGATLIKPNRNEAFLATDIKLDSLERQKQAAQQIKRLTDATYVLLSLDSEGMMLYENHECFASVSTKALEVFDVVGAGDMATSVLGFLMAIKAPIEHAVFLANLAAGMEIQHVGVVSFTKDELLQQLEHGPISNKIITPEKLQPLLQREERQKVFTNGYFDNISAGHLRFLQQLRQFDGIRIVAINSDESIKHQKGQYPLLNQSDRASILASIDVIDWIVIFDHSNASELLQSLKPHIVVKGESYRHKTVEEKQTIEDIGATLEYLKEYNLP